ncbi:hypothetical protein Zmor_015075 [Zophobas morio]|uniref:Uncharacterized protein n=1 Tax=Zophobas morio TaxID=2755281 RepID=A0AA38IIK0_9CUCU|nr:hypothetical protein Zmor_015075 [Zophobas morio]
MYNKYPRTVIFLIKMLALLLELLLNMVFSGLGQFGAADLARPTWRGTFWRKANLAQGHFGASHLGVDHLGANELAPRKMDIIIQKLYPLLA